MSETAFDRAMALLRMPDVRSAGPSTIVANNPLLGHSSTHVVQTAFHPEDGFTVYLQVIDAGGVTQVVLPDKVVRAILRQTTRAKMKPVKPLTPEQREKLKVKLARELLKSHREKNRARQSNGGNC